MRENIAQILQAVRNRDIENTIDLMHSFTNILSQTFGVQTTVEAYVKKIGAKIPERTNLQLAELKFLFVIKDSVFAKSQDLDFIDYLDTFNVGMSCFFTITKCTEYDQMLKNNKEYTVLSNTDYEAVEKEYYPVVQCFLKNKQNNTQPRCFMM